jgi:hypothetical protein
VESEKVMDTTERGRHESNCPPQGTLQNSPVGTTKTHKRITFKMQARCLTAGRNFGEQVYERNTVKL